MNDLFQRENQVFKPTSLFNIGTSTLWGGDRLGRPILFPSKMYQSFYLSVFWIMLLFHCILTLMNDLFQRENQVFKPTGLLVLLHCGVGKDWVDPFFLPPPPPPQCSDLSIYLSVFWIILLFHCILTLMNDLFQRESQVFKHTSLLVLLHCGVGKDWAHWAGPFFTPPPPPHIKCFYLSFYLSMFWIILLFHCILTFMNDLFQ